MASLIGGGVSLLGSLFGGDDPPEWKDISERPEDYDYDPTGSALREYQNVLGAGREAQGLLGTMKNQQLNRRRRQAAEMIPGMASFRATPGSQGITGGTSAVLARKNYSDAQTRGQEWADANFNATPYDLAIAEMPLRSYQVASPFFGMDQERLKTRTALSTEAKFMNQQGRMGQANAGWQQRQSKWNALGNFGASMIGLGVGSEMQSSKLEKYAKMFPTGSLQERGLLDLNDLPKMGNDYIDSPPERVYDSSDIYKIG
jgi:hypothetical protein